MQQNMYAVKVYSSIGICKPERIQSYYTRAVIQSVNSINVCVRSVGHINDAAQIQQVHEHNSELH